MISSSGASFETALADPAASSVSISTNGDDANFQQRRAISPPLNPIHIFAANQANTEGVIPIHITRVSQDTVYVKSESATTMQAQARLADAGRAIGHGLENGTHKIGAMASHLAHPGNPNQGGKHRQHTITTRLPQSNVVEGPNGLTPPPSPPSPGSMGDHRDIDVDQPNAEEIDETTFPTTPRKSSADSYNTPSNYISFVFQLPIFVLTRSTCRNHSDSSLDDCAAQPKNRQLPPTQTKK